MAKVLYEKAVEQGFEQATKRLELLSGDNTTYLEFEELADDYYEKKNYTEALKYYKMAASGIRGSVESNRVYVFGRAWCC